MNKYFIILLFVCSLSSGQSLFKGQNGDEDAGYTLIPLNQTSRNWRGMCVFNGNVYAAVNSGDIYMQTNGTGDFSGLSQTGYEWIYLASSASHVYAASQTHISTTYFRIYKQTSGSGNFNSYYEKTDVYAFSSIAINGTDIYVTQINRDVLRQTNETGAFIDLSETHRNWRGGCAFNGNVYLVVYGGDIYMQTNGTGTFDALSQGDKNWTYMTTSSTDVYACVAGGDIYKQVAGSGNFTAMGILHKNWQGMAVLGDYLYVSDYGGDIYKIKLK